MKNKTKKPIFLMLLLVVTFSFFLISNVGATTWSSDLNNSLTRVFDMDESSGGMVDNLSIQNGVIVGADYNTTGKINGGYTFVSGNSDYVNLSNNSIIGGDSSFTLSMWINPTATSGVYTLYSDWGAVPNTIYVRISSNEMQMFLHNGTAQYGGTTASFTSTGVWSHIVAWYNGTQFTTYINGVAGTNYSMTGNAGPGKSELLGATSTLANFYNGSMDMVYIWKNTSLNDTQIQQIYNSGNGLTYNSSVGGGGSDNPPTVTLNSPADALHQTSSSVTFNATVTDDFIVQNVSLYIDGILNDTNTSQVSGEYTFTKILSNGNHNWSILAYDNNSASTQSSTRSMYIGSWDWTDPSILMYYDFEDSSGQLTDSVGSYNLTPQYTPVYGVPGKIGNTIRANSNGDKFVSTTDVSALDFGTTEDFTVSFWIRSNSTGEDSFVFQTADAQPWYICSRDSYGYGNGTADWVICGVANGGAEDRMYTWDASYNYSTDVWHHVVFTRNNSGQDLYMARDGNWVIINLDQAPNHVLNDANAQIFYIFDRRNDTYSNFLVDEFMLLNRSISLAEVQTLYNGGSGLTYNSVPTITLNSPADLYSSTNGTVTFNGNATTSGTITNVSLIVNNSYNDTNTSGLAGDYTFIKIFSSGAYSWNMEVCDNNGCTNGTTRTFTINESSAPEIHLISPNNNSFQVSLSAITNATDVNNVTNLTYYIWNSSGFVDSKFFPYEGAYSKRYSGIYFNGIDNYNGYIYGVDAGYSKLYKYYPNFTLASSSDINSSYPSGITNNGTYFWISDYNDNRIYRYLVNGTYSDFNFTTLATNLLGVMFYNDTLYALDNSVPKIYEYYLNGTYKNISLNPLRSQPSGITYYNGYFYITNLGGQIDKHYTNGTWTGTSFTVDAESSLFLRDITVYNDYFYIPQIYDITAINELFTNGSNLNNKSMNYTPSISDGNYIWNAYGCDSLGNCGFSQEGNYTLTIDTTTPQIDFSTGTASDLANLVQNFIYVNVTYNETNFQNITFSLYSGGLINSTNFTTETSSVNWTGLSQGATYIYNVTIFDKVNKSATTSTRTITLANPGGTTTVGGGGGITVVGTGNWTMETAPKQYSYDKVLPAGTGVTLPIIFYNTGEKNQTITLSCVDINRTMCNYVDLGNATFNLPLIKDLQTVRYFTITLPEDIEPQTAVFNIVGTDDDKRINSISVTISTGNQAVPVELASKMTLNSSTVFGLPYALIFGISLFLSFFVLGKIIPKKTPLKTLLVIGLSFLISILLVYFL